jgi:predicted transcriptional regulator of viral defense system
MTARGRKPDHACLFDVASSQHGFFTTSQALECGYGTDLLTHQTRSGRFRRVYRGVYRMRDYPSSSHEDVAAAWLALGRESAVVSHESALDLYELSDVIPDAVHLTVPRSRRYLFALTGVRLHTSTKPLDPSEIVERDGVRVTTPARSILDAADTGVGPEQIEMAVRQALGRGLVTAEQLRKGAADRPRRVNKLVEGALSEASV